MLGKIEAVVEILEDAKRHSVTDELPEVDSGTLYVLGDVADVKEKGKTFSIRVFHGEFDAYEKNIIKSIELNREEAEQFRAIWRKQGFQRKVLAQGHFPQYGIILRSGKKTVFETSIHIEGGAFWFDAGFGKYVTAWYDPWLAEGKVLEDFLKQLAEK